jgi:hypothetical protein
MQADVQDGMPLYPAIFQEAEALVVVHRAVVTRIQQAATVLRDM